MITYPTDKLQKVLLSGGCVQRNLPSGYTQVEYLQSSGTQYIDTGYKPNNNTKVKAQILCPDFNTFIFGSRSDISGDSQKRFGLFFATKWNPQYANENGIGHSTTTTSTIYNIEISQEGFYVNGGLNTSFASETFSGDYNMYLFANNTADTSIGYGFCKIYSFEIYTNNVLAHKYIPCKNSSNVLGMYDTVSDTFFTNQGTGDFIAGPDVPTPDEPMDIVCNNGVLKYGVIGKNLFNKNDSGLGNGYIESASGRILTNNRGHTGFFKVKPNTKYHVTLDEYQQGSQNGIAFYDNDKNFVAGISSSDSYGRPSHNFTVPNNNSIVYARLTLTNNIASTGLDIIQIEQGSTATSYEPYQAGIYTDGTQEVVTDNLDNTANAEMLLAVGDYIDKQSVLNGVVTRKVGIKVLDGTEEWGTSTKYCWNLLSETGTTLAAYCTHFKIENTIPPSSDGGTALWGKMFPSSYGLAIGARAVEASEVSSTVFLDVEDWNAYLATQYANGTPVIIVYPLAEPTTEQVTPQPLSGSSATVTAGSIDNLPIESSTIAELKKRYIGDREVKRVYIGDNLVWKNN